MKGQRHRRDSLLLDGDQVRKLRLEKGLTQAALAKQAELSRELISRVEAGGYHCGSNVLKSVADELGVATERLLVGWREAQPALVLQPAASTSAAQRFPSHLPVALGPVVGRVTEMEFLTSAHESSTTAVVYLEAEGGAGKTSLVSTWLDAVHVDQPEIRIYDYSFNSDEFSTVPSAQAMLNHAFQTFGLGTPENISGDLKCEAIATAVLSRPTVFVLDGLEVQQYAPGHPQEGRIIDPNLRTLLRRLAQIATRSGTLIVLTSRQRVPDLQQWEGQSVLRKELPGLDFDAAQAILTSYHIRGRRNDVLLPLYGYTKGHALTLHLLAGYIEDRFSGDGRAWAEHEDLTDVPRAGTDAKWVMTLYERWFANEPEKLQLLGIVSLFDGSVAMDDLDGFLRQTTIQGLTDRIAQLTTRRRLRLLGQLQRSRLLLAVDGHHSAVDMHVIVREYFRSRLQSRQPVVWRKANAWLSDHFLKKIAGTPDTVEDALAVFSAIKFACRSGEFRDGYRIYVDKIHRAGTDSIVRRFGLFADDLSTLYSFFDLERGQPVSKLQKRESVFIAVQAASRLRWIGRLHDCSQIMRWTLDEIAGNAHYAADALVATRYVAETALLQGRLRGAERESRAACRLARSQGQWIDQMAALTIHGAALHQLGQMEQAEQRFLEAESIYQREYPGELLNSVRAHRFHDLLLDRKRYAEVIERSRTLLQPRNRQAIFALDLGPVDDGCAYLSLGIAQLRSRHGSATEIRGVLDQALSLLNSSGRREYIYQSQMALAEWRTAIHDFPQALQALEAVRYECDQDEMQRLVVDIDLWMARNLGYLREKETALKVLARAESKLKRFGYLRRREELDDLRLKIVAQTLQAPALLKLEETVLDGSEPDTIRTARH